MRTVAEIEALIDKDDDTNASSLSAPALLGLGEETLEHWICAKGDVPTLGEVEGFRILALHRQGAKGDPSFNACRESCRELVYHYNLILAEPDHAATRTRLTHMHQLVRHMFYFVTGKMQQTQLGEFCCSSRPLRLNEEPLPFDGGTDAYGARMQSPR
jgi:hypothetical protein